jgi:hypothetical protein
VITVASGTKYNDYQIIGCTAPGVKLAGILVRRYIGTSELCIVLQNRKRKQTSFGCGRDTGGRLIRSSDEVPVMGMERRDKHVRFQNNLQPKGKIDWYETESQPMALVIGISRNE